MNEFFPCERKKMGKGSKAMTIVSGILYGQGGIGPDRNVPEHLMNLRIPPAWTNVTVNPDPTAKCYAMGYDVKGRQCRLYAPHHTKAASDAKFSKVSKLIPLADKIRAKLEKAINGKNPSEEAIVAYLIFTMGLRPGSNTDTLADAQAYGATTLQARHVKIMGSGAVWLDFIGKKGVKIHLKVWDIKLGDILLLRKQAANGARKVPLFKTNNGKLNTYIKTLAPGMNPKDLRTLLANQLALKFMEGKRIPQVKTKAKLLLRKLFQHVSKVLANTPAVVKKSYINPEVYQPLTDVICG